MRNRILPIINILLLCVCGWCIYRLATYEYQKPREIAQAEEILTDGVKGPGPTDSETSAGGEAKVVPPGSTPTQTPQPSPPELNKPMFVAIWTATPTPTPTPSPTPAPPDLKSAAEGFEITSIDGDKVEFVDKRSPGATETFILTVGGPPKATVDAQNKPIEVQLIAVDTTNNKVTLGYQTQTVEKSMF